MNNFKMDKRDILQRISRGLQWENKPPKLKRSIIDSVLVTFREICNSRDPNLVISIYVSSLY